MPVSIFLSNRPLKTLRTWLRGQIAAKNPCIRRKHILKRLRLAKYHLAWTPYDWERVMWSYDSLLRFSVHMESVMSAGVLEVDYTLIS